MTGQILAPIGCSTPNFLSVISLCCDSLLLSRSYVFRPVRFNEIPPSQKTKICRRSEIVASQASLPRLGPRLACAMHILGGLRWVVSASPVNDNCLRTNSVDLAPSPTSPLRFFGYNVSAVACCTRSIILLPWSGEDTSGNSVVQRQATKRSLFPARRRLRFRRSIGFRLASNLLFAFAVYSR